MEFCLKVVLSEESFSTPCEGPSRRVRSTYPVFGRLFRCLVLPKGLQRQNKLIAEDNDAVTVVKLT